MIIDGEKSTMAGVARVESAYTVYLSALPLFVSTVVVSEFIFSVSTDCFQKCFLQLTFNLEDGGFTRDFQGQLRVFLR